MSNTITLVNHFVGKMVMINHTTEGTIFGRVTEILAQGVTIVHGVYNEDTIFIPWAFIKEIKHTMSLLADDNACHTQAGGEIAQELSADIELQAEIVEE